jgi:hypothetical protein
MWNFVMDKSGPGVGYLRKHRFPLPIYIPSTSSQSSSLSLEAGTIGQEVAAVPTASQTKLRKKLISYMTLLHVSFINYKTEQDVTF